MGLRTADSIRVRVGPPIPRPSLAEGSTRGVRIRQRTSSRGRRRRAREGVPPGTIRAGQPTLPACCWKCSTADAAGCACGASKRPRAPACSFACDEVKKEASKDPPRVACRATGCGSAVEKGSPSTNPIRRRRLVSRSNAMSLHGLCGYRQRSPRRPPARSEVPLFVKSLRSSATINTSPWCAPDEDVRFEPAIFPGAYRDHGLANQ